MPSRYALLPAELRQLIIQRVFDGFPHASSMSTYPDPRATALRRNMINLALAYPQLAHEVDYVVSKIHAQAYEERPKAFTEAYAAFARVKEVQRENERASMGWRDAEWEDEEVLRGVAERALRAAGDAERCVRAVQVQCCEIRTAIARLKVSEEVWGAECARFWSGEVGCGEEEGR